MSGSDGNIIEIIFRAVVDQLAPGLDEAKADVKSAVDDIKASTAEAAAATDASMGSAAESMTGFGAAATAAASKVYDSIAQMKDFALVDAAVEGGVSSMEELGAATDAVLRLQKAGLLTETELAAAFDALEVAETKATAAEIKLAEARAAATLAAEAETAATLEESSAHTVSGQTARELGVMTGETLRGNYTRLEGSAITLANRTGLLQMAFTGMGAVVLGVVAVIGTLVYGMVAGAIETAKYNEAIASTGNYAGTTAGAMHQLAVEVSGGTVTIGEAAGAIEKMVASGRLNNEQMRLGADAAAGWARITGEGADKIAEKIIALSRDPTKAIIGLNEQYNFLTSAEYAHIAQLQAEGDTAGATTEALRALSEASTSRTASMVEDAGSVQRAWEFVKGTLGDVKDAIASIGRTQTYQDQIDVLKTSLTGLQATLARGQKMTWDLDGLHDVQKEIDKTETAINNLSDLKMGADWLAQNEAQTAAIHKAGVAATAETMKKIAGLKDENAFLLRRNEIVERYTAMEKEDANNPLLKNVKFDQGKPVSGGGFQDEVDKAKKDTTPKVDHSAERAAHKLDMQEKRDTLTAIQIERDATKKAGEERLAEDDKVTATALALYGKDSAQYRQALNQKAADQQAFDAKKAALAAVYADAELQTTLRGLQEDGRIAQTEYRNKQITAEQLLAIENDLVTKKLAAEERYYAEKKALAEGSGDDVGAARAAVEIQVAQADAHNAMRQNEESYLQESQQRWARWGDAVSNSVGGMVQGLIFQGNSWRQAWVGMLGSMLQSVLGFAQQWLAKMITTKLAEVAAHLTGNAIKATSDKLTAKQSVADNAGAAIKKIIANAAEVFTSVYKAIAGIPYVGPFLAPVMAVAAGAVVIGMVSKVASAERGWERVPADGMMTELHKDEMVLPADVADPLRGMAKGGGGGGEVHFHVNTMDTRGVKQFLKDNVDHVADALRSRAGNFRFEG